MARAGTKAYDWVQEKRKNGIGLSATMCQLDLLDAHHGCIDS